MKRPALASTRPGTGAVAPDAQRLRSIGRNSRTRSGRSYLPCNYPDLPPALSGIRSIRNDEIGQQSAYNRDQAETLRVHPHRQFAYDIGFNQAE